MACIIFSKINLSQSVGDVFAISVKVSHLKQALKENMR